MAQDSTQIVVPGAGSLYLAPVGTALPTDITTPLNAAFKDVGLLVEDSLGFGSQADVFRIRSFGVARPTRVGKRSSQETFSAAMQQWNTANLKAFFGGGAVTVATGVATYNPPTDTFIQEYAAVFQMADGTKNYRLVIAKTRNVAGFQLNLRDNDAAGMPLQLEVEGGGAGSAWYLVSDDATSLVAG